MPSIGRKLTYSYVLISLITVLVLESLFGMAIYQYYVSGMSQTLVNHAEASATMYDKYAPAGTIDDKAAYIYENMKVDENALVEVYGPNRQFIIDNTGNKSSHVTLGKDYEEALLGDTAIWRGRTKTNESIMSVSVPLKDRDQVVGVLRYVSSMAPAHSVMRSNAVMALILGLTILLVAALLGYMMSHRILVPIKDLIRVTQEVTAGNLTVKAKRYYHDEIGHLANVFNKMTDEIQRSNQAKTDFISSISHELRTPLTSIKGWAETIDDNIKDDETVQLGIDIIDRETNRLIHLVNDLLDFSKLQSHRIELNIDTLWLDDLLKGIYHQFAAKANQENVIMRLHLDSQEPIILADEDRLRQVLINIIDNSFKFVKGRPNAEIIVQSHMLDDQVVITIEDNGPGMSSEELVRVKEKFYKGSTKQSGTGLGLSIANEIVELHKGTLYIDSIRGIGTKVSVVLPIADRDLEGSMMTDTAYKQKSTDA
ncbi:MAG: HAMP domain-containing sensor histidine kinase [Clostridiales bacterium]|nr:HAMP domain-containing sensor histidine kinase [Clostridiales bacterium]